MKLKQIKKYFWNFNTGGFGKRGTEGKIAAINYARKNNIPFWVYVLVCRWQ